MDFQTQIEESSQGSPGQELTSFLDQSKMRQELWLWRLFIWIILVQTLLVDYQLYLRQKDHLLIKHNKNIDEINIVYLNSIQIIILEVLFEEVDECNKLRIWIIIEFIIKNQILLMKQKFSFEENDSRPYIPYSKESQVTQNKRLSPDYSSVLQNHNINMADTNQLSWLQKFAEDNQKICSSGLFDQNLLNSRVPNVTNQMKFSFNMNYTVEDRRRQDCSLAYNSRNNQSSHLNHNHSTNKIRRDQLQNVLSDIKNNDNVPKGRSRKDSLAGSIKKNQKINKQLNHQQVSQYQRQIAQNTPLSKLDEMHEKLNKVLQKDRSSSILNTNTNNKQNVRKDSSYRDGVKPIMKGQQVYINSNTQKFEDSLKYYQRSRDVSLQPKKQIRHKQIQTTNIGLDKCLNIPKVNYESSLQLLFNKLDKNQTGKLSKMNCNTEFVPQEFKFILGNVLTKIKFKQFTCNKRQFIQLCQGIIRELESTEVIDLLNRYFPSKNQPSKVNHSKEVYINNTHHDQWQPIDETKRYNQKNPFQTFQAKQFKKSVSLLENACKIDSKIQSRANLTLFTEDRPAKISSQSIRKYNQYEKPLKKSTIFDESYPYYPKNSDMQYTNKIHLNDTYSSKKYSNISETMIEQHKRGLDNLTRLNKRMQSCLNTNILTQHNKQGLMREDNLTFHELIKHV